MVYRFYCMALFHSQTRSHMVSSNNRKNRSFRNRENLQYKKTADSVKLSLFMRTNRKYNDSHTPKHRLKRYSAFRQNPMFLKDHNTKKISTLSMHGKKFYQLYPAQQKSMKSVQNCTGFIMKPVQFCTDFI